MRRWIILAESAYPFDEERIISDLWTSDGADRLVQYFRIDQGREPYDRDGDGDDPDFEAKFKAWFWDYVSEQIENTYLRLRHLIRDGKIEVWRDITAPRDFKLDPNRHPGIHWSWDPDAAQAHWGDFSDGNVEWTIHGFVREQDIDWVRTIFQNVSPDFVDEKEITIKADAPVEIVSVY